MATGYFVAHYRDQQVAYVNTAMKLCYFRIPWLKSDSYGKDSKWTKMYCATAWLLIMFVPSILLTAMRIP